MHVVTPTELHDKRTSCRVRAHEGFDHCGVDLFPGPKQDVMELIWTTLSFATPIRCEVLPARGEWLPPKQETLPKPLPITSMIPSLGGEAVRFFASTVSPMSQAAVAKIVKGVSGGNTATLLTSYDRPARVQCLVVLKTQDSRNVNAVHSCTQLVIYTGRT